MSSIASFKDLVVWQKSMLVVKEVYQISSQLPKHELYALGDQMRRCSVSIPSNIAEGCKRHNTKEFRQFCGIAQGSAAELETQLILVMDIYHIDGISTLLADLLEVQKMLTKLSQKLTHLPTTR